MQPRYPKIEVLIGRLQDLDKIKSLVSNALTINKVNRREVLQFNRNCEFITDLDKLINYVMEWVYIK